MNIIFLLALTLLPGTQSDVFAARSDLQAMYDEISQTTLQFLTPTDVDDFHDVVCTHDWVFVDTKGQKQAWPQARSQAVQALSAPPPQSMVQRIQKLTVEANGAKTVVALTTIHTMVDNEGRYGRPGASHTLQETTVFRDQWVKISGEWKMQSREQVGQPKVLVDRPAAEPEARGIIDAS